MAATVPVVVPTVAEAAAAFLDTCTAPSTRRSYTHDHDPPDHRLRDRASHRPGRRGAAGAAHHQLVQRGAGC
jgi:hypothetical protein